MSRKRPPATRSGHVVIRPAYRLDYNALNAAAERFARRHRIRLTGPARGQDYFVRLQMELSTPRHRRLWRDCLRRAVNAPDAYRVDYGYILGAPTKK